MIGGPGGETRPRAPEGACPSPAAPLAGILMGPTASGKTALAVALAGSLPIEIVSADSRQVYHGLRIGTAMPTAAERAAVAHHLIDFLALDATYDAARFAAEALAACAAIRARARIPLVVGGAGFYLKVLEEGLFEPPYTREAQAEVRRTLSTWSPEALREELQRRDPERSAQIHPNDRFRLSRALEICIAASSSVTALTARRPRVDRRFVKFRLVLPRPTLHARIEARARAMLAAGWAEEVRALLDAGFAPDVPGLAALGYPEIVALVRGRQDEATTLAQIVHATRRFARHQETWFRKARAATLLHFDDPHAVTALRAGLAGAFGA